MLQSMYQYNEPSVHYEGQFNQYIMNQPINRSFERPNNQPYNHSNNVTMHSASYNMQPMSIIESLNRLNGYEVHQTGHHSSNQTFNQTNNQMINQSARQPIYRSFKQSNIQSNSESTNHLEPSHTSSYIAANTSLEPRKTRQIKTSHAIRLLKNSFLSNPKPNKEEMQMLARSSGCSYSQICRYFRNERHKAKKALSNYQSIKQVNKAKRKNQSNNEESMVNLIENRSCSSTTSSPTSPTSTLSAEPIVNNQPLNGVAEWISTFHNHFTRNSM